MIDPVHSQLNTTKQHKLLNLSHYTIKEFLEGIQTASKTSFRNPNLYTLGKVSFLESDYFKDQIKSLSPRNHLKSLLDQMKGLPDKIIKVSGNDLTIDQALELDLARFVRETGLNARGTSKARHQLLDTSQTSNDNKTNMESVRSKCRQK